MPQALKIVSACTSGLLASLRLVIALDLAILLLWIFGEITYNVRKSDYSWLAVIFAVTLVATPGLTAWRWWKPQHFGVTTAYSDSLNVWPLVILDVVLILSAVFVSDQLQKPLCTPLLHFSQAMIHKLTV